MVLYIESLRRSVECDGAKCRGAGLPATLPHPPPYYFCALPPPTIIITIFSCRFLLLRAAACSCSTCLTWERFTRAWNYISENKILVIRVLFLLFLQLLTVVIVSLEWLICGASVTLFFTISNCFLYYFRGYLLKFLLSLKI